MNFIRANIHHCNLFTSVYNFSDFHLPSFFPKYDSAIIDRVYVDCDNKIIIGKDENNKAIYEPVEENGYRPLMKIHDWCVKKGYIHAPYLTGNGYNIYIATKPNFMIRNKKSCLHNAQSWLCKDELNIVVDTQIFGDIARISRIPFTWNFKAGRICIPLTPSIIDKGDEFIKTIAQDKHKVKQLQKECNFYGSEFWDISQFDMPEFKYRDPLPIEQDIDPEVIKNMSADLADGAPDCVKLALSNPFLGWELRKDVIVGLRDNGYLLEETIVILKKHLSPKKFRHCMSPQDGRQPFYLYGRENMMFPTWESMRAKGMCPFDNYNKCKHYKRWCGNYGREM